MTALISSSISSSELEGEMQTVISERNQWRSRSIEAEEQLSEANIELNDLRKTILSLQRTHDALIEKSKCLVLEITELKNVRAADELQLLHMGNENNGLKNDLERINDTTLSYESNALPGEIKADHTESASLMNEESSMLLLHERDELLHKVARVTAELDNSRIEISLLHERLEEASSERKVRSCRIEELEDEVEEVRELEDELLDCRDQLSDALELCETYKSELSSAWQQLSSSQSELAALRTALRSQSTSEMPETGNDDACMVSYSMEHITSRPGDEPPNYTAQQKAIDLQEVEADNVVSSETFEHSLKESWARETTLHHKVSNLEWKLDDSLTEVSRISHLNEELTEKLRLANAKIASYERFEMGLDHGDRSVDAALEFERQRNATLEGILSEVNSNAIEKEKEFQKAVLQRDDLEKQVKHFEARLAVSDEEIIRLKECLQSVRDQNLQLTSNLSHSEREQQSLKHQLEALKIVDEGLRVEIRRLQDLYEGLCLKNNEMILSQESLIKQHEKELKHTKELQSLLHQKEDQWNLQQLFIESLQQQHEEERQALQSSTQLLKENLERITLEHQKQIAELSNACESQLQDLQGSHQQVVANFNAELVIKWLEKVLLLKFRCVRGSIARSR